LAPAVAVGAGTINQSGGTFDVSAARDGLARLTVDGTAAFYNLSGATALLKGNGVLAVGSSSAGSFNQTGGSNTLPSVILGEGTLGAGTYTISGAAALATTSLTVGNFGSGSFLQQAGSTVSAQNIIIAAIEGGSGTYDLRGGTLSAERIEVNASGAGTFLQSGGAATANQFSLGADVNLLPLGGSVGTNRAQATLSAGSLHAVNETVGENRDATFTQIGGTNTCDGTLVIGSRGNAPIGFPDASGQYTLSGSGTLAAQRIVVNPPGSLTVTGNRVTLDCADLLVQGTLATRSEFVPVGTNGAPTFSHNTTLAPGSTTDLVGGLNLAAGTLTLQDAVVGGGVNPIDLDAASKLTGCGSVMIDVDNAGAIQADAGNLVLRGANLTNSGTLGNNPGASLFVKAATLTNTGNVGVSAGGAVVFDQPLTIPAGKTLTLAGGTLGTPRLANAAGGDVSGFGQVAGDFDSLAATTFNGPTQIVGNFTNRAGATLTVRNDQTLITGQTVNNGTITTVNGKVIFDGGLSGGGGPAAGAMPAAPAGAAALGGAVTLNGDSTLITPYLRQHSLTLAGSPTAPAVVSMRPKAFGGKTSVLNVLSIPSAGGTMTGRLDLADNALIIDYEAVPSPLVSVREAIVSGFHGGDWGGNGISSTLAAIDSSKAVGYAEAGDVLGNDGGGFAGQAADGSSVLVRFTLAGDATLDGAVDFNDLVRLAQNYNTAVSASSDDWWARGDFTYDGIVDFNDLVKLAQNYNGAAGAAADIPGASGAFDRDLARAFSSVPEPAASIPLLVVLSSLLTPTRRRRRKAGAGV
jgi:hypothetical protein